MMTNSHLDMSNNHQNGHHLTWTHPTTPSGDANVSNYDGNDASQALGTFSFFSFLLFYAQLVTSTASTTTIVPNNDTRARDADAF